MAGERQIAYLWVPYFGTGVAQRAEPGLQGRPLVLLDEHDRALDADPLAIKAGVLPGLPAQQAAARCPQAVLLPAVRFPLWEAGDRLLERVRGYADRWQPAGLGRVYFDVTGLAAADRADAGRQVRGVERELLGWCQAVASAVRGLGWQPAVGATGSKFGAQVAGMMAGQNSALLLGTAIQRAFLAGQPVTTLPLDPDALRQLRHLGIRTLGQFASLPVAGVLTRFGPAGRTAQRWAQGLDDRPVVPLWEAPEVSARIEFETPVAHRDLLLAALMRQAERLLAPLRQQFQAIVRILLTVTRADGRVLPVSHAFPLPTAAAEPVRLALGGLLDRVAWDGQGAVEFSLTFAGITDAPGQQLPLFDLADGSRARLTATLDRLAGRFGADSFRLAFLVDDENPLPERRISLVPWQ